MYVKFLTAQAHGQVVYDNSGSARRATNYLEQEAKANGQQAEFFSAEQKGMLSGDEVVAMLDQNHKGLSKDAAKFYSLVLSPSAEEVAQLGNDPAAMQRYTREAMELYAQNFHLKNGKQLHESDLVWAATIHQERKNRGTDEGISGEHKPGLQTHIHVVVSARDAAQQITLNPFGKSERFNRVEFQAQVNTELDERLGKTNHHELGSAAPSRPQRVREKAADIKEKAAAARAKKPLTPEQVAAKEARLDQQVARLNTKLNARNQLDPQRVQEAAKERGYDNIFYARLGQLERSAERDRPKAHPYEYLRTGLVQPASELHVVPGYRPPLPTYQEKERTVAAPVAMQSLERSLHSLSRALSVKSRTQDVRSEAEKQQDSELEW